MPGSRSPRLPRHDFRMAYIVESDLYAYISKEDINPFIDDDGDGVADTSRLDQIIATAQLQVDGRLAPIYTVPISPTPTLCKIATVIFTCEALYARRITPDRANPFKDQADAMREQLKEIGAGKLPLDATVTRVFTPGAVVTSPIAFNVTSL